VDETWHRLQTWTSGQASSERLAAQVLTAEGFEELDPIHPLGGPDGGRDATCRKDGMCWAVAVYFPGRQHTFREIEGKFKADLAGVSRNNSAAFVFVTNQALTEGQREGLRLLARGMPTEIYHVERLVVVLDRALNASCPRPVSRCLRP
jgi:hypothetical protein